MSGANKLRLFKVFHLLFVLIVLSGLIWRRGPFGALDNLFYDRIMRYSVDADLGPPGSDEILYLVITDETYDAINKNFFPRSLLARTNAILKTHTARLILYDLVFSRHQNKIDDNLFQESLKYQNNIYLPAGFGLDLQNSPIDASRYHKKFHELNTGLVPQVGKKYLPDPIFMNHVGAAGHVSAPADPDGVFRHLNLFVRDGKQLIPSLALIAWLDMQGIDTKSVEIKWGESIRIPDKQNPGAHTLKIPIDEAGRVLLPYSDTFANDFEAITLHDFLKLDDDNHSGSIAELVENRIVFIGDISTGISDTGITPLETRVPLVAIHATLMSALLNKYFIRECNATEALLVSLFIVVLFYLFSLPEKRRYLNLFSLILLISLPLLSIALHYFKFRFPAMTLELLSVFCFVPQFFIKEILLYQKNQKLKIENDLLKKELELARKIQQDILPGNLVQSKNFAIEKVCIPAREVGGDFYDVIQITSDHLVIAIGDVSGKGIWAALYMSAVVSSFRSIIINSEAESFDLIKYINSLNNVLCYKSESRQKTMFVTAAFLSIHIPTGKLEYIRCGHEPILISNQGKFSQINTKGMMLGVLAGEKFRNSLEKYEMQLLENQKIVLFTDGVIEAKNETEQFFSLERLIATLESTSHMNMSLQERSRSLLDTLGLFAGLKDQYDDITYILLEWKSLHAKS